ncbi:hypothetical protein [Haloechinothrix salitolerans]|uniref:Transcriptional regulator, AbiEi antitoxin, Type IV TA system n=1 Tax=Haloechinothrix salitolerans TaxID=926830 RepID=A0ABW2C7G8_9PSEU
MTNPHRTLRITPGTVRDGIATTAALRDAGLSRGMISTRCRPGGPWQRLLPGVVMLATGTPTRRQKLRAAVEYAGQNSVITGEDALAAHGVSVEPRDPVRLLVPTSKRLSPRDFVVPERSTRLPRPVFVDELPFAPPARAAIDVARVASDVMALRSVLAMVLHNGLCSPTELSDELDAGNQRGSAAVRAALRDSDLLATMFLHAQANQVLRSAPLPRPRWQVTITDTKEHVLGYADAWWDEVGLAWQIERGGAAECRAAHRHLALTAAGVTVVCTSSEQVLAAENDTEVKGRIIRALASAFLTAARCGGRPTVHATSEAVPNAA